MIFFIDLESTQRKLSSGYSLNICFSHRFPHIDVHHSLRTNPYKMSIFKGAVFFHGIVLTY